MFVDFIDSTFLCYDCPCATSMAVKLSSLVLSKRIPRWVQLNSSLSSLSSANIIAINPETDHNPSNSFEFESNIEILKAGLHPDSLVHVLDSTADVNSSVKVFKWASLQKKFKHSADTYSRMILKLGMAGNIEEMEGFCNEMVKEKCPGFDESLLALMDSFIKCHRLDEALRVLSCMNSSSFKPSIGVFNELMGALVKAKKDFKDVLFVYKEMVKVGIIPNVETLNCLLEALFEADRVDMTLNQYRRMNRKGCSPNSKTYKLLISGLIAREQVDESLVILNEMFNLGCELDLSFYSHIIPLFCRAYEFEAAMRLFARMRASKLCPDSSTYGVIIQGLCQNLTMDNAISVFKEMIDYGLTPEDNVYVDIVNGFCKLYRFSEAEKFLEYNDVDSTRPYNALLVAYCNIGSFVAAKDLFDEMFERNRTDCLSCNILIRFLSENGGIKKALEVLSRMIVLSFVPNSSTYAALMVGKCKQDDYTDAMMLFNQLQKKWWVVDSVTYAELVECLCRNEKIQEAAEAFSYMSSRNVALQSSSFNVLIKGVCAIGEVNAAIRFLFLARSSNTYCSLATYNTIMGALSKLEKTDNLLVLLSKMVVDGCSPNEETYCILIQGLSIANQADSCAWFFSMMLSQGLLPNSETVASILSCLEKHSQLHMILFAIDKLIFDSDILDSLMFNLLVHGLSKEGYKSAASRFLDIMLEKGWVPDTKTHRLLMDSGAREESDIVGEYFSKQDEVSSILAEALVKN